MTSIASQNEPPVTASASGARIYSGVTTAPQPLTGMDMVMGHLVSPFLLVYPQGLDAQALAQSLGQVLRHYPLYSSRLTRDASGQVQIDGCDQGVPFTVKHHAGPLPAYGIERPMGADLRRYSTAVLPWRVVGRDVAPLMVELHQFACGGTVLSVMSLHSVSDGTALWNFMLDWVRTHLGHPVRPLVLDRQPLTALAQAHAHLPYTQDHVREVSSVQRAAIMARFGWQMLAHLRKRVWRVSPERLAAWRAQAVAESGSEAAPSALDMLVAHCVQTMSPHLRSSAPRNICAVTDLRLRRVAGMSRRYVGNGGWRDHITLSAQVLAERSTVEVARLCQRPLTHVSEHDILSGLGLLERHRQAHSTHRLVIDGAVRCLGAGIVLNNGAHFPIYKVDFGAGPPTWFDNHRGPFRRLMITPAPPHAGGGVDVHLSAHRAELAAFPEGVW